MTDAALSPIRSRTFALDGLRFVSDLGGRLSPSALPPETYLLRKPDAVLEFYRGLVREKPRYILELGMLHGGSMVLWDRLFEPETLVGVDARQAPIETIERYRADRPYIHTFYGRHADKPGTRAAARESFPEGIDLVIDDATHRYPAARDAFEALFPLVRVGGTYVIENWAWAHRPAAQQAAHSGWRQPAVTNFVFELSILAVTAPVVDSIHVEEGLVAVRKGPGHLPAGGIADALALRGRELATI